MSEGADVAEGAQAWRRAARQHWEVLAAAGILTVVLASIDVASIREPALLLSFGPLAFLVCAALVPLTARRLGAWIAAFVLLAVATGEARYAGFAYPAVALALLFLARRWRRPS